MELKNFFAQDDDGNYLPGATCYLYQRGTENLVSGLLQANGVALENPFLAANDGLIQLAAPNGLYDLRVSTGTRDRRILLQFRDLNEDVVNAREAATRAESARDAALLSGGVYASISLGLVATANGGYFSVPSDAENEYLVLYRNDSGTAEVIKRYPAAQAVADALSSAVHSFRTRAAMEGNLKPEEGISGYVTDDPTDANNGWYSKVGASGAGSWQRMTLQPVSENNLASIIRSGSTSNADRPFFSVTDEHGYGGMHVGNEEVRTDGLHLTKHQISSSAFDATMVAAFTSITDEYGFSSVFIGPREMKALIEMRDRLEAANDTLSTSYAPITSSVQKIVAHRGLHITAPENSLDAYRLAAQAGFKYVETDISRTSDGRYVLCHDTSLNRTFVKADGTAISGTVTIAEKTFAELRSGYKLASTVTRFQRQIPSLEEFLRTCADYGLYPYIELKDPTFTEADFAAVNDLCVASLGNEFMYISGNPSRLASMRAVNPNVMLGYVYNSLTESYYTSALQNKPSCIDVNYTGLTEEWVRRAKKDGILVAAWTVPAIDFDAVRKLGVEHVAGDDLAPNLGRQQIVFSNNTGGDFSAYFNSGVLSAGLVTLSSGQKLTLKNNDVIKFGGAYVAIEYSGSLTIGLAGSTKSVSSVEGDTYRTQVLLKDSSAGLTVTAGVGGCVIREISVALASFV